MSAKQAEHPARETLAAFGSGKLDPTEAVSVEEHLSECEECCETLHGLGSDTFVDLIRESNAMQIDSVDVGTIGLDEAGQVTVSDLPPELTKHSRYHVLELIGKGGMGNVYKAEHTLMNREVALKVISHELVQNAQAVQRFRREVQSAARLAHPNIVAAYDAEQAGDTHFLVMEHVPGETLSEVVKREGPLDVVRACGVLGQAAAGLQHAHEQGMVHRDVKPHNLMITAEGQVKILDFGLASLAAHVAVEEERSEPLPTHASTPNLTSAGSMMGTPDFVSPEQAGDARSADIRSDIYSLGCTFYYLLTGRPPFTDGSALERVKAHCQLEPELIEQVCSDIPPEVGDIVRRMMEKKPAERFQTPAEVVDALEPFFEHPMSPTRRETESRSRATAPHRFWRPPMNTLTVTCAAMAIVLAGIIYLATDNGMLVIESDDEAVQIIILPAAGETKDSMTAAAELRMVDTITGSDARRLPSGEYVLNLKGDQNDFQLSQERFILKRSDEVVVKVTRKRIEQTPERVALRERLAVPGWAGRDERGFDRDFRVVSISQDGRYCTLRGRGDLTLLDLITKNETRLSQESRVFWRTNAVISPKNEWVAYRKADYENGPELWAVRIDGTGARPLYSAKQKGRIYIRGWSPDSRQVLFSYRNSTSHTGDIVVASVEDSSFSVVKKLTQVSNPSPCFSPDGKYIAYDRQTAPKQEDIYVLRLEDGMETPLIEHPADDDVIGWTPDGKSFLFRSNRLGAGDDAWAVPLADGKTAGEPYLVKKDITEGSQDSLRTSSGFYFSKGFRIHFLAILTSRETVKECCTENLTAVAKAIEEYRSDHGELPNWLSDLRVDAHLHDPNFLICPADTTGGTNLHDMDGSYQYRSNDSDLAWKDVKEFELKYFGGVTPIAQCRHHGSLLTVTCDGQIYERVGSWQTSPQALEGLLSRLKNAVEANPNTWAEQYDLSACISYLVQCKEVGQLAKMISEHLKEHPNLASQGAEELLRALSNIRIAAQKKDNAEERDNGEMTDIGPDLDFGKRERIVGIRFSDIRIPKGSKVKQAFIQFTADRGVLRQSQPTELTIYAELTSDAREFTTTKHNLSSRHRTTASVNWTPKPWSVVWERSVKQRTPDLSSLIQEVVNQQDWQPGNALSLIIIGSGDRGAASYQSGQKSAPMLYTEY